MCDIFNYDFIKGAAFNNNKTWFRQAENNDLEQVLKSGLRFEDLEEFSFIEEYFGNNLSPEASLTQVFNKSFARFAFGNAQGCIALLGLQRPNKQLGQSLSKVTNINIDYSQIALPWFAATSSVNRHKKEILSLAPKTIAAFSKNCPLLFNVTAFSINKNAKNIDQNLNKNTRLKWLSSCGFTIGNASQMFSQTTNKEFLIYPFIKLNI